MEDNQQEVVQPYRFTMEVSPELGARLRRHAEKREISMSSVVKTFLVEGLDAAERKEKEIA